MAATYSVYNIIFLMARFANTLQAPLLSKRVELSILQNEPIDYYLFYSLIFFSFLGGVAGAFSIPTMQRFMAKAVEKAHAKNAIYQLLTGIYKKSTLKHLRQSLKLPNVDNFRRLIRINDLPIGIISMNLIITALLTVSVLACLYAGYLNPELRTTCLSMNGFIVGLSVILSMLITEPHLSILGDKVAFQGMDEGYFRRYLGLVVVARLVGSGLSFLLLVPMAKFVVFLAQHIF
jgi:hypothetical protein